MPSPRSSHATCISGLPLPLFVYLGVLGDVVSSVRLKERVVSINKTPISTPQVISIILIIEPHIVLGNPKMHCQEEVEKQQGPMSGGLFGKLHQEHLALIILN